MSITAEKFVRKPFTIEAIRVTSNNLEEVAEWIGGKILNDHGAEYIKVNVNRPLNERQSKAFVGDWVLKAGTGNKVYTNKAFNNCFQKAGPVVRQSDLEDGSNLWPSQEPLFGAPVAECVGYGE